MGVGHVGGLSEVTLITLNVLNCTYRPNISSAFQVQCATLMTLMTLRLSALRALRTENIFLMKKVCVDQCGHPFLSSNLAERFECLVS